MTLTNGNRLLARAFSLSAKCHEELSQKKLLKVALVGAPNAGKSTLLNQLVYSNVSCVSNKVHTTRSNILGVLTEENTQIEFYDSPGIITKNHLLKHKLESSLYQDPQKAAETCDLIAVVADVANIREQKRLNAGVLRLLNENRDKESILILNKVDLLKDKRRLLDIGTRLTQGCLKGNLRMSLNDIRKLDDRELRELNLSAHINVRKESTKRDERKFKHVIYLNDKPNVNLNVKETEFDPDSISYKNFSQIFSISALNDDGVDELRNHLIDQAKPVERFPHSPDYLTNQSARDIVMAIVRGNVMDLMPHAIPYLLKYKYQCFETDETGSLHVNLLIKCPERYMVGKVIGDKGSILFQVIGESRDQISKALGCDVKLNIEVKHQKLNV